MSIKNIDVRRNYQTVQLNTALTTLAKQAFPSNSRLLLNSSHDVVLFSGHQRSIKKSVWPRLLLIATSFVTPLGALQVHEPEQKETTLSISEPVNVNGDPHGRALPQPNPALTKSILAAPSYPTERKMSPVALVTERERDYVNQFKTWFNYLEGLEHASVLKANETARLKVSWDTLKQSVKEGSKADRLVLDAIWVDLLFRELNAPTHKAVHFDDPQFNVLCQSFENGKLSTSEFSEKTKARALNGVYSYLAHRGFENPLLPNADEWYTPIIRALEEHPRSEDVQRSGSNLLSTCFPKMSPERQMALSQQFRQLYQDTAPGSAKLSAMNNCISMQWDAPKLENWAAFRTDILNDIKQITTANSPSQKQQGTLTYHLVLLARHQDKALEPTLEALVKGDKEPAHPTQLAVAWALGQFHNDTSLKLLDTIAHQPRWQLPAREMSIFSIAEIAEKTPYSDVKTQAEALLEKLAKDDSAYPAEFKEAVRVMKSRRQDNLSETNYFVNKFITSPEERQNYLELRKTYIVGWEKLDVKRQNMVDKALIPYRQFLPDIIKQGGRHTILSESYTELSSYQKHLGGRVSDGRLNDNIKGISSVWGGTATHPDWIVPGGYNTVAHEFTHQLESMILNNQAGMPEKITKMYETALREKRLFKYYQAANKMEYLAECAEAMERPYSPHYYLWYGIFNNGYDSGLDTIRSKLKRVDPDAFEFFEKLRSIPLEISLRILEQYSKAAYAIAVNQLKYTKPKLQASPFSRELFCDAAV